MPGLRTEDRSPRQKRSTPFAAPAGRKQIKTLCAYTFADTSRLKGYEPVTSKSGTAPDPRQPQRFRRPAHPAGLTAPVIVIIAVAVGCIILAVFSSAQRADLVALERERGLFAHTLSERRALLQQEVDHIASLKHARQRLWDERNHTWIDEQIEQRLVHRLRDTIVMLVDPTTNFVAVLDGEELLPATWTPRLVMASIGPMLPDLEMRSDPRTGRHTLHAPDSVSRVLEFLSLPAVVAAAPLRGDEPTAASVRHAPLLVMANILLDSFVDDTRARLDLPNLRLLAPGAVAGTDNAFALKTDAGTSLARYAWTPKRPGGEIIRNTLPFVCGALSCFVLLAAFVLRYIRHATKAIEAGEDRLRHAAMHDTLSALPNRTLFFEHLEAMIRAVRGGGEASALLSIDLDHFKDVNDTLGHDKGDALIAAVGQRLRSLVGAGDLVARLGGDEFAVLTGASTDLAAVNALAAGIISSLSAPYLVAGHSMLIGASIGIVVIDGSANEAADILRFADLALYRAKNGGRSRACIYDAAMNADLRQRKQLEHDLRNALTEGGLTVAYQPMVDPNGERTIGVEALCRWSHPLRGDIPPSEFISLAEQGELIFALGEWILRQACLDARAWPDITVAVNVSPLQFRHPDFFAVVRRILDETGFDPNRLELELTESMLLGNVDGAESVMRRLKNSGVRLALDDFGTGYSSLLYLRRFPFDKLKIDRSFVSNIETAADAAAIVHAIVSLGRGLDMQITAEGVETAEQQLFLRAAGVHAMQGFRFGRPGPAAAITARLAAAAVAAAPGALPQPLGSVRRTA